MQTYEELNKYMKTNDQATLFKYPCMGGHAKYDKLNDFS